MPDFDDSLGGHTLGDDDNENRFDKSLGDQHTIGDANIEEDLLDDGIKLEDLSERYTEERVLGQGGFGQVVLATDIRLNRQVAIKRILGKAARSKTATQRFLTEAKSIAALNHNNIVQIYDYGRSTEGPFLIMECVQGGSLLDKCKEGPIELEEAVNIFSQLCDGLAKAHAANIIHRDIKPANVLISEDGVPKLTDFGLAKDDTADTGMTMEGAVIGTLDFMPPEQREGAHLTDHRSDLWSLAATFYQMVTGDSPTVIDITDFPPSLQPVISKALKRSKEERYQSALEMKEALLANLPPSEDNGLTPGIDTDHNVAREGECPKCLTKNDLNRKFCSNGNCAAPLRVACLACNVQVAVWEQVCGECGGVQAELRRGAALYEEAQKHREAFDYAAAINAMRLFPESARTPEAAEYLTQLIEDQKESKALISIISDRLKSGDIKGLSKLVTRALELRGDRTDLQKIKERLVEREHKEQQQVTLAFEQANLLLERGNAKKAFELIELINTDELDETDKAFHSQLKIINQSEMELSQLLKQCNTDGIVDADETIELYIAADEYLCFNPCHEKIGQMHAELSKRLQDKELVTQASKQAFWQLPAEILLSYPVELVFEKWEPILRLEGLTPSNTPELYKRNEYLIDVEYVDYAKKDRPEYFTGYFRCHSFIEEDAAVSLGTHKGAEEYEIMSLDSLQAISPSAASHLAMYNQGLNLSGLTRLHVSVIRGLNYFVGNLDLSGVTKLSKLALCELGNLQCESLTLGLKELQAHGTESIGGYVGKLILDNLTELSVEAAKVLGTHTGDLILNGLTTLYVEQARALANHSGLLLLNGLTKLSDEVAHELGNHTGDLQLNGVTNLSDEAAQYLGNHIGGLSLDGLTDLSDESATSLSQLKRNTDQELQLSLLGLKRLSDNAAKSLRELDGYLNLSTPNLSITAKKLLSDMLHEEALTWYDDDWLN